MFKINIATKDGKTFKLEAEAPALVGKKLKEKVSGKDVSPDLEGYEFEICGASDKAGFTAMENVDGEGVKKVLLTYGKAMKKRPRREGKKKQLCKKPKGLRLRRTVRGNTISDAITQVNLKVSKDGAKKLSEIFPDQNKIADESEKNSEQIQQSSEDNVSSGGRGFRDEEGKKPSESASEEKEEVKTEEKPAEEKVEEKKE